MFQDDFGGLHVVCNQRLVGNRKVTGNPNGYTK